MSEFPIEFSPTIGAVAGALAKAQGEMKDAAKDATNPHFKNKYATLSSVREAVTPALSKNGLAVTQYFEPHGLEAVCVITLLMHSSGEWIKSKLVLPVSKKDAQGMGSAISYGRRYALASICNIASDDDDDANAAAGKPTERAAPTAAPPAAQPVDWAALISNLANAKDTKALSEASIAFGRVAKDATEETRKLARTAHDNRMRELESQEKAA